MLALIAVSVFFTVLAVVGVILKKDSPDKKLIKDRLNSFVNNKTEISISTNKQAGQWRIVLKHLSKAFDSPFFTRLLEQKIMQAGWPLKSSEFIVISLASGISGFIIMFIFFKKIALAFIGLGLCALFPWVILNIKIAQRINAFNDQLGDALVLIANSLRTGYSFMQALDLVAKEMPPPISVEFARTLRELNLGLVTEEAMNNLAKRVNSDSLDLVITAVLIQRQVGGNLAEILDNISSTIRERIKLKREIKTLTAQGRTSGLIIGVLPIGLGLIIYVLNPEYVGILFSTSIGKLLLLVAFISEMLGVFIIRSIVNIEM